MTNEEIITQLQDIKCHCQEMYEAEIKNGDASSSIWRKDVEALDLAIKKEEQTRWIPVSERLPKDHENVLIYLSSNQITIGLYNSHKLPFRDEPMGWGVDAQISVYNFCSDDVIAWMPLPQPYKEENNDN